jgi:AraC-like DNA-binding protein
MELEDVPRPVVAVGNEYPDGHRHPAHKHARSQLLFAERGTMLVETSDGAWIVPPYQAIWIPCGTTHSISMLGQVGTRSVYLDLTTAAGMATQCQVRRVSPLLRQLLIEAVDIPPRYDPADRNGKIMSLLVDEIQAAPVITLNLPFPGSPKLAARCRRFVAQPTAQDTIDLWHQELGLSRRTFTRIFKRETGLTFNAWQRRACLMSALPRLLTGESVTAIAFDLGYSSPAAFTMMFKQLMGSAPHFYRRDES